MLLHVIKAGIGSKRWMVGRCFIVEESDLNFVNNERTENIS